MLNLHYFFERVIVARHSDDSQRVWGHGRPQPIDRWFVAALRQPHVIFASMWFLASCDGIKVPRHRRSELHCYFRVG
jgi:hypothetical protein